MPKTGFTNWTWTLIEPTAKPFKQNKKIFKCKQHCSHSSAKGFLFLQTKMFEKFELDVFFFFCFGEKKKLNNEWENGTYASFELFKIKKNAMVFWLKALWRTQLSLYEAYTVFKWRENSKIQFNILNGKFFTIHQNVMIVNL